MLLRYIPETTVILVGHSLFFQAFFRNYLCKLDGSDDAGLDDMVVSDDAKESEKAEDEKPDAEGTPEPDSKAELWNLLKKKKLMNAGCALCDVEFSDDLPKDFEITDVKLMFGTKLV